MIYRCQLYSIEICHFATIRDCIWTRNWGLLPVPVTAWHSQATAANNFTSHKQIRCWIPSQFAEQKPQKPNQSHVCRWLAEDCQRAAVSHNQDRRRWRAPTVWRSFWKRSYKGLWKSFCPRGDRRWVRVTSHASILWLVVCLSDLRAQAVLSPLKWDTYAKNAPD